MEQSVQTGRWTDFSTGQDLLLKSDYWATVGKTYIAVCLTLSGPYIFKALMRLLFHLDRLRLWLFVQGETGTLQEQATLLPHEDDGTLDSAEQDRAISEGVARSRKKSSSTVIKDSTSGRVLLVNAHRTGWFALLLTIAFGGWIARTVAGYFSARVASDRAAIWASNNCGIWGFDSENAGDEAAARADVYDREKEQRSGEYAQSCYGNSTMLHSIGCEFFYQPKIPYKRILTDPFQCPFNQSICIPGVPSVAFDTGIVDSSILGINAKSTYKFRRSARCAPLRSEYPYVQKRTEKGLTTYHYHFGKLVDVYENPPETISNYTYSTEGNPFDQLAPVYSLRTYASSLYPEWDYWVPVAELIPPKNSTITIMFVSALHILYLKPSADPIFPADKKIYLDDYSKPWYYKSDPIARALACVDTTQLCSPDGKECWSMTDERNGTKFPAEYWLMKLSLESSSVFDSINKRLGSALQAQEKVTQFASPPLSDYQWMAEAERLFATSLARIQFDAFNIASGEDQVHEVDGFIPQTPEEAPDLCGIFKFKCTGYTNLNYIALWCLGLPITILCFLLTLEVGTVVEFFCGLVGKIVEGFYIFFPERRNKGKSHDSERGRTVASSESSPAEQSNVEEDITSPPGSSTTTPAPAVNIVSSLTDEADEEDDAEAEQQETHSNNESDSQSTVRHGKMTTVEEPDVEDASPSPSSEHQLEDVPLDSTTSSIQGEVTLNEPTRSNAKPQPAASLETQANPSAAPKNLDDHDDPPSLTKPSAKDSDELVIEWVVRQLLLLLLAILAGISLVLVNGLWDKALVPIFVWCGRYMRKLR